MEWSTTNDSNCVEELNIIDEYIPQPDDEEIKKYERQLSIGLETSTTSSSECNSSD
jgi:hypothetical protein